MSELSSDFIVDLAKACIMNKDILEVVRAPFSYSYLPSEPHKEIFKYIFDYHGAHQKPPTIGLLAQNVNSREALSIIEQIRKANIHDHKDELLSTFEDYIKRSRFFETQNKIAEMFGKGDIDRAYDVAAKEYGELLDFSLKRKMHSRIYADFDKRQTERQNKDFTVRKIRTGIPAFDYHTRGGVDRGTSILGVARSGAGKTAMLRSLGFHASFSGVNVLHIASGDSTQEEIENGYDAMWTGIEINNIKEGVLDGADINKIEKARKAYLAEAGEIFIHVFKQFNTASILDCRAILIDLIKEYDIGLVLFDLLEGFEPGDGKKYGTGQDGVSARKKATSEKIVGIATEFDIVTAAVTQASDIKKEFWNDPNFVITRNNISNLKSTVDPFSYVLTLNQTEDEKDRDEMRIHEEKIRHYKVPSYLATYSIASQREFGRFINVAETNKKFWNNETKEIIRHAVPKKEKIAKA